MPITDSNRSAEAQNAIRRAQKAKQAKGRAQAKTEVRVPDTYALTGHLDLPWLCRSDYVERYGCVTKANIVELMKHRKLQVVINDDQPMYAGQEIWPTPAGFREPEGALISGLTRVTAYVTAPYALLFLWVRDRDDPSRHLMLIK
jgi:hypothetical protein